MSERLKEIIKERGIKIKWVAKNVFKPPISVFTINRYLNGGDAPSGFHGKDHRRQINEWAGETIWEVE